MSVSEQERHALHSKLGSVLGEKEAATIMSLLPPVGWADVATKHDLDHVAGSTSREIEHLAAAMRGEHEQLESRLTARIADAEKRMLLAMSTMLVTVVAVSGLAFAAAGLT